jgi:GAF domain-containing protein
MLAEMQHVIASSDGLIGLFRRSMTFSNYVIYRPDEIFVILDASGDERFAGNPHVDDGLVSFYAGTAIFDTAGHAVGALCVSDSNPRQSFSTQEAALVSIYAARVSATLG